MKLTHFQTEREGFCKGCKQFKRIFLVAYDRYLCRDCSLTSGPARWKSGIEGNQMTERERIEPSKEAVKLDTCKWAVLVTNSNVPREPIAIFTYLDMAHAFGEQEYKGRYTVEEIDFAQLRRELEEAKQKIVCLDVELDLKHRELESSRLALQESQQRVKDLEIELIKSLKN